ncbi:hypothetical protein DEO72_LG8g1290 [Vigna unguiculata]|uniref:Uncharacterized protein n=1 Tax=Vigna unguiculata TaxID=3917 RepID=A0A4D6MPB3_VIGUN|nr:hypothetical protein DEO72_LG8g1290 [Vigna unguiculata]
MPVELFGCMWVAVTRENSASERLAQAMRVSPKRECAEVTIYLCRALAWAKEARLSERPSRLSETLQPERRVERDCVLV